jgi:hypothetical protein
MGYNITIFNARNHGFSVVRAALLFSSGGKTCTGSEAGAGAYVVLLRSAQSRRAGEITLRTARGG